MSLALALLAIPVQAEAAGDFDPNPDGYNRRISEDPKNPKLFMARAFMYHHTGYKAGHLDLALADYTTAISLDPDFAEAYEGRGEVYELKGDLDRAILDYDQAIRLDQIFAQALYRRGVVKTSQGGRCRGRRRYCCREEIGSRNRSSHQSRDTKTNVKLIIDRATTDTAAVCQP